jgi:raffinose/stachyose/melibiose transport system permease protein
MISFTVLTVVPLVWMILSAFKPHAEIVRHPLMPPLSWYFDNFVLAWTQGHLGIYFLNSIFYSVVATVVTVLLALSGGYALSKFFYRSGKFIYMLYTLGLLITVHSVIVPLFIMETRLGISNTRLGVVLPYIAFGLPFQVFLSTTYIKGIRIRSRSLRSSTERTTSRYSGESLFRWLLRSSRRCSSIHSLGTGTSSFWC